MGNPTTFTNFRVRPLVLSTTPLTLNPRVHAGKTINLSIAATQTITLPSATGSGDIYHIACSITATGNKVIQVGRTADTMGGIALVATDTGGLVIPTAATSDTITLNGTTTGGLVGSHIVLTDVAENLWSVNAMLVSSGAEGTPFSAAV